MAHGLPHGKHHHRRRRHRGSRSGYGWQPPWWAQQDDDDDDDDDSEYEYEGEYGDEEFAPPSDSGRWVRHGDKIIVLNAWR